MDDVSHGRWIGYSLASGAGGVWALSTQVNWLGILAVIVPILPPIVKELLSYRREVMRSREKLPKEEKGKDARTHKVCEADRESEADQKSEAKDSRV